MRAVWLYILFALSSLLCTLGEEKELGNNYKVVLFYSIAYCLSPCDGDVVDVIVWLSETSSLIKHYQRYANWCVCIVLIIILLMIKTKTK